MTLRDETHLDALIEDAALAITASTAGPQDLLDYNEILRQLQQAGDQLPALHREAIQAPLLSTFAGIRETGWADVLRRDPTREGLAMMGFDLTQAVLQRANDTFGPATHAMQEVVSDLYDGFLSAADRRGVEPPDHGVIPPMVKWGRPDFGPYAWPAPATSAYGCEAGIVNMPPAFTTRGLAAWSALSHETAGHAVLHADEGLHEALASAVEKKIKGTRDPILNKQQRRDALAEYWASRVDETASDLMGIVNMGPAAAVGIIAYFRALGQVFRGEPVLSSVGSASAVHPAGLARGYLMAYGLGLCSFAESSDWEELILEEVERDAPGEVQLANMSFTPEEVRLSAKLTAEAILLTSMEPLENRSLISIQDWRPRDQQITQALLIHVILGPAELPPQAHHAVFAAHAVSAAVIAALLTGECQHAQQRMVQTAAAMHATNPSMSPLGPTFSGNLVPHSFQPEFAMSQTGRAYMGGGQSAALLFGGDPVPWLFGRFAPATRFGGSNVPWFLGSAGLGLDPKKGAWKLVDPTSTTVSTSKQKPSQKMLKALLGAPAWLV